MACAGGDDVLVAVGRAEIDISIFSTGTPRCTETYEAAPIAVPASPDAGCTNSSLRSGRAMIFWFSLTLSAPPPEKARRPVSFEDVAEVMLDHLQRQVLEQLLHARRVVDVRVVGNVAVAHRAQPVDQLRREVVALALLLVAAEANHVGVVGVDDQLAVLELRQAREIVLGRVAVGAMPMTLYSPSSISKPRYSVSAP